LGSDIRPRVDLTHRGDWGATAALIMFSLPMLVGFRARLSSTGKARFHVQHRVRGVAANISTSRWCVNDAHTGTSLYAESLMTLTTGKHGLTQTSYARSPLIAASNGMCAAIDLAAAFLTNKMWLDSASTNLRSPCIRGVSRQVIGPRSGPRGGRRRMCSRRSVCSGFIGARQRQRRRIGSRLRRTAHKFTSTIPQLSFDSSRIRTQIQAGVQIGRSSRDARRRESNTAAAILDPEAPAYGSQAMSMGGNMKFHACRGILRTITKLN